MGRVKQAIHEMPSIDEMMEKKPGTKPFRRAASLGYYVGALVVVGLAALLFPSGPYTLTGPYLAAVTLVVVAASLVGIACAVAAAVAYQVHRQR